MGKGWAKPEHDGQRMMGTCAWGRRAAPLGGRRRWFQQVKWPRPGARRGLQRVPAQVQHCGAARRPRHARQLGQRARAEQVSQAVRAAAGQRPAQHHWLRPRLHLRPGRSLGRSLGHSLGHAAAAGVAQSTCRGVAARPMPLGPPAAPLQGAEGAWSG
jgi:hypothetical protein